MIQIKFNIIPWCQLDTAPMHNALRISPLGQPDTTHKTKPSPHRLVSPPCGGLAAAGAAAAMNLLDHSVTHSLTRYYMVTTWSSAS
jgi:hypothetical protein